MRRDALSRPVRLVLRHELLDPSKSFFDYGCGRGDDIATLRKDGFDVGGWDPYHRADAELAPADVVNLGYVVNVIEDPMERAETVRRAWRLARGILVVSARLEDERDEAHVAPVRDGWITRRGTFQKFFAHDELGHWIEQVLQEKPVSAGLGVYYVFRDPAVREGYLASRFRRPVALLRRRASDTAYEDHRDLLEPLIEFVELRGRLPAENEIETVELAAAFGSVRRAFRVVQWVTDEKAWDQVRLERSVDLLVHLALALFHGRPRWSDLPEPEQRDVRAFFSNYKAACAKADKLLFATGNRDAILVACHAAVVGKLTPTALYVHTSALNDLPALLRVYEGCAQALVGTVEDVTLVKLFRNEPAVSYLSYPDFDRDPHPSLVESVHCDLQGRRVRYQSFRKRENPPILHRKELFLNESHPLRAKFERLTKAEERAGLFDRAETIGTRDGWERNCEAQGVRIVGHRVVRRNPASS
jgi:DNA phosphorothioation-associated putative methyltransferase